MFKKIIVLFQEQSHQLIIEIIDDGQGFDPSALIKGMGGNGLKNMRQRSEKIGATLNIETRLHQGTKVELSVPI